jgi:glycosyltransferase involved in cell wall biosynthesis
MRLLFVTQKLDADDPVLGSVIGNVAALADRFERVTVIANEVGRVPGGLPAEVISLGREDGDSKTARAVRYQRLLLGATRAGNSVGLLAHMCPVYVNLANPVLRLRRAPLLLWFAHPSVTLTLRAADRLASLVVTSLPGAYPLPGPKVRVIGQAVDVERFPFSPRSREGRLRLIAAGRTSPSKGFSTIIRAVAAARAEGVDAHLRIVGPSTTREEIEHRTSLQASMRAQLGDAGSLEHGMHHADMALAIANADVLVNDMVAGSGDKVVFEAAALGRPVLVSNPAFSALLEDLPIHARFPPGDHAALAQRIIQVAQAEESVLLTTAKELRLRVERDHSVSHWAGAVRAAFEEAS